MLKGHVFSLQTFSNGAFALFIDKFLHERCGVAKGCALSNTNNSATIGEGYFVVRGRFLQVIGNETVSGISTNGFYSLVCEVDLSKTNTADTLNQAEIKTIYGASNYPTLTQQDITGSGTVYQYEFARFKVEGGQITNFTDRRTYVDFESLYDIFESRLESIENLSNVLLKTGGTASGDFNFTGNIVTNSLKNTNNKRYLNETDFVTLTASKTVNANSSSNGSIQYPSGFTFENSRIIAWQVVQAGKRYRDYKSLSNGALTTFTVSQDSSYIQYSIINDSVASKTYSIEIMILKIS